MNVLFLTAWYPTPENPVGGVFVREHARAAAVHHDVTVLHVVARPHPIVRPWQVTEELDPDLTQGIRTLRVTRGPHGEPYPLKLYSSYKAAKALKPDIVHAHIYEAAVPAILVARRLGIPIVATEQWSGFSRRILGWRQIVQTRAGLGLADRVLPVSSALADAVRGYVGSGVRMQVVPNVVDTAVFRPASAAGAVGLRRLLFAAILDEADTKGLPLLLRALADVREMPMPWRLDVVGDGPSRTRCEVLAAALGLTDRVTFHGFRAKRELAVFMRDADLFVLPSKWDNMPCVVVEALASGTPVLATRVGGLPEMITPENGRLVQPGDVAALTASLKRMLADVETFDRTAIAAEAAARYSLEAVGAQLDRIYCELAGVRRALATPQLVASARP